MHRLVTFDRPHASALTGTQIAASDLLPYASDLLINHGLPHLEWTRNRFEAQASFRIDFDTTRALECQPNDARIGSGRGDEVILKILLVA
jgi:hypothetical protein